MQWIVLAAALSLAIVGFVAAAPAAEAGGIWQCNGTDCGRLVGVSDIDYDVCLGDAEAENDPCA